RRAYGISKCSCGVWCAHFQAPSPAGLQRRYPAVGPPTPKSPAVPLPRSKMSPRMFRTHVYEISRLESKTFPAHPPFEDFLSSVFLLYPIQTSLMHVAPACLPYAVRRPVQYRPISSACTVRWQYGARWEMREKAEECGGGHNVSAASQ